MSWLGLDIGGANLKAANAAGWARSIPFALWRDPHALAGALAGLLERAPRTDRLAVTMTGELCDCFRTKAEGVHHILSAVRETAGGKETIVYLVDGRFVAPAVAHESPHLAAASNWRALAQFACRYVTSGSGLLIDVGSTTTDIIPIAEGRVTAQGRTDMERLALRELVYSGVGRTPICAVINALPWRGSFCPVAAEVFSTTADACLLLGKTGEERQANWTADGRPLVVEYARQRLARQLCADAADFKDDDFNRMA
jgi:(4-(4-[2-(gamma-L-glutamylamino)ethyl]phenoxymethyl)furan-2-yl)methanamine synthase